MKVPNELKTVVSGAFLTKFQKDVDSAATRVVSARKKATAVYNKSVKDFWNSKDVVAFRALGAKLDKQYEEVTGQQQIRHYLRNYEGDKPYKISAPNDHKDVFTVRSATSRNYWRAEPKNLNDAVIQFSSWTLDNDEVRDIQQELEDTLKKYQHEYNMALAEIALGKDMQDAIALLKKYGVTL